MRCLIIANLLILSLWSQGQTVSNDGKAIEVGTRFTALTNGKITGVKFYKNPDAATYVAKVYDNTGKVLGSGTITNTTLGWATVNITPIQAYTGLSYTVSFYSPGGFYAANSTWFNSYLQVGFLNYTGGFYTYASAYPNSKFQASYYYVDPLFTADPKDTVRIRDTVTIVKTDTVKQYFTTRDTIVVIDTVLRVEGFAVHDTLYKFITDTVWLYANSGNDSMVNVIRNMDQVEFSLPPMSNKPAERLRFTRGFIWIRERFTNGVWVRED